MINMKIFTAFRRIVYIGLLVAALWYLNSLKANPATAEEWTRGYVRMIVQYPIMASAYVPISITEIAAVLIAIVLLILVVQFLVNLFKGRGVKAINKLLLAGVFVLVPVTLYFFSCQLAYNREDIPLPFHQDPVASSEFVDIYNYYADDINNIIANDLEFEANGEIKSDFDLATLTDEVIAAHSIADDDYYHPFVGNVKGMLSSPLFTELQITGLAFAPFGEANINTLNTKIGLPLTIAHELAHTRGVMLEDDASQLAFYVCLNSDSPYLRYSAYAATFYQLEVMVSETYISAAERENLHPIDTTFNLSRNYVNSYWAEHDLLGDIGDKINDLYIKSSGIEDGTDSYNGGTQIETDPVTLELVPSLYQKLYFEKYYRV
jgi:hypothetical protein